MTDSQWQQAWEIFRRARELEPDQRESYLAAVCTDPETRVEVGALLEPEAEDDAQPAASHAGTTFGRYEIGELLGTGGMGEVYSAHDPELDRIVAIKFLSPAMAAGGAALERLIREARSASALNHPNIVTVYEVTRSGGDVAIAMELVEGKALRSYCSEPPQIARVAQWGTQIAQALAAAHQRGIVHRDIKPENVMVREDGIVKILDFGLARSGDAASGVEGLASLGRGTLNYMSPEQAVGNGATPASDVFSLGIVLYELATGQHPFRGGSPLDTMHAIVNEQPRHASSWNHSIPAGLDALIASMLEKERTMRPSASEVARQLTALGLPLQSGRASRWVAIAALLAVGVFGTAGYVLRARIFPAREPVVTRVTSQVSENRAISAGISPDAKRLAFSTIDGSIFMRRMSDGLSQVLATPPAFLADRIIWLPGGLNLLVSGSIPPKNSLGETERSVWVVPANGTAAQKLLDDARDAAISPDGKSVAFANADESEVCVAAADGTARRRLLGGIRGITYSALVWSPDGKRIIMQRKQDVWLDKLKRGAGVERYGTYRYSYVAVDTADGRVTSQVDDFRMVAAFALADGRVFFLRWASPQQPETGQIFQVRTDLATSKPLGTPRQLGHVRQMMSDISVSSDGNQVVTVVSVGGSPNVYIADLAPAGRTPQLLNIRRLTYSEGSEFPHAWTEGEKGIIFESDRNGHYDLFRQNLGQRIAQPIVVSTEMKVMAQLTPDGQWLLYHQRAGAETWRVMRVRPQGGTPETVLPNPVEAEFRCPTKQGTHCVIRTVEGGQYVFHELDPIRGIGRELGRTRLTPSITGEWDVAPDGSRVAIPVHDLRSAAIRLVSLRVKGGADRETVMPLQGLSELEGVIWAADGRGWFVSTGREHGSTLFYVDRNGAASELYQTTGLIFVVPSPDGKHVAFPDWSGVGNVWLIQRQ